MALAFASAAHAQQPERTFPDDVRAAGQAAYDYAKALPNFYLQTNETVDWLLNKTPAQLRDFIARDRATIAKSTDALAKLKLPAKAKDFDVTFALKSMRDAAAAKLVAGNKTIDALGAMIDAQAAGDCAAYATHTDSLRQAHQELRAVELWRDMEAIDAFISRFASRPAREELMSVRPAPYDHKQLLADHLAASLRCPLPAAGVEIEVVSIPFLATARPDDKVYVHARVTSGVDASQRQEIERRFASYPLQDIWRFKTWKDMKLPLNFRWDGQVLSPVTE